MRLLTWTIGFLALVAAAVAGAFAWYAWAVRPVVDGTLEADGLGAPVEIVRDAEGIPHIFASDRRDAYFALGWVHAQDRLWQMEFQRRVANGRLAEILGEPGLAPDRFLRTIGIRRAAEAIVGRMDPGTRAGFDAYAAGVNAVLTSRPGPPPPEFLILGAPAPEPWTAADSVGWTLMMAWDLGENLSDEILRMRLAQRGWTRERIDEFLPNEGGAPYPVRPDYGALWAGVLAPPPREAAAAPPIAPKGPGVGSNNWVVAGARTASGKPMLANDPHLGLAAPSLWYFAHLSAPGLEVVGGTLPGVPGVILGRNDRIAWGFTNTGPDVQDLFIEKIDPADPARYLTPDGSLPFETVEERIRVKGGEDVILTVRISRHGPIISDGAHGAAGELLAPGHAMAFAWTALSPENATTASAADAFASAGSVAEFIEAARLFKAPQQNMVVADVDGAIGYVAPGLIPVRRPDNDVMGLAPVPGWTGRYDWTGWLPFEDLPREVDPPRGYRHTANERIVPPDYPHFLRFDFDVPYRADRIRDLLEATPKHDRDSFRAIQADVRANGFARLLPAMLPVPGRTDEERAVLEGLRAWDFDAAADRWEPLVANAWLRELVRLVTADDLGDLFPGEWQPRPEFMSGVLADRDGMAAWCDDVRSPVAETCRDRIADAFTAALADLKRRYGDDRSAWTWGAAHAARSKHNPFAEVPLLAALFDVRVPVGGDRYALNVAWTRFADEDEPFTVTHGPSLRAIYDLSDLERSEFMTSTGQSGLVVSPLYDAFAERWAAVDFVPIRTRRDAIEPSALGTLRLEPRR